MGQERTSRVYEQIALTNLTADGITPAGLELTERALSHWDFSPSTKIIDVGCGTGATLARLKRIHELCGIGIDPSAILLDQGRRKGSDLTFVLGAGENLPFRDESANGVFAECSLSATADRDRVLDDIRRVLKVGGRLVLSDVYARNGDALDQLSRVPVGCCLRGAVSRAQLIKELATRNLRIDLWEGHSERLTEFAVQLIFSCGSMEQFWARNGSESADRQDIQRAISATKPGYFLLIAQRVADEGKTPIGG